MAKVKSFGERIADALVEDGLLSAGQVEELLEQQKKEGARLVKLIVDKSYVSEQDLAVCMGRVLNVPPVNLARISIPEEISDLLPRETEYNHKVVPVARLENKLFLAMADPLNVLALDDVKRITKLEITPLIAQCRKMKKYLDLLPITIAHARLHPSWRWIPCDGGRDLFNKCPMRVLRHPEQQIGAKGLLLLKSQQAFHSLVKNHDLTVEIGHHDQGIGVVKYVFEVIL